jgi:hypothetical protein
MPPPMDIGKPPVRTRFGACQVHAEKLYIYYISLWMPEDRAVSQDSMGTIAEAQRAYSRHSAQARADALLASLHDGTADGKRAPARLLNVACRPASAWLDTLPLSRALELKSGEFQAAL